MENINYKENTVEKFVGIFSNTSENNYSFSIGGDCEQLLSFSARICGLFGSCDEKCFNLSAEIIFDAVFLDRQNELVKKTFTAPLEQKVLEDSVGQNCNAICTGEVLDTTFALSNDEVKATCNFEFRTLIICKEQIVSVQGGENVFVESNTFGISSIVTKKENFVIEDEKPLEKIDKILFSTAKVILKDSYLSNSILQVEGDICVLVAYLFDDKLEKLEYVLPFREEFSAPIEGKVYANINCLEVESSLEQSKNDTLLATKFNMSAYFVIFQTSALELVGDAFVKDFNSRTTTQSLSLANFDANLFLRENFEGKTEIDESFEDTNFVLSQRATITNLNREENRLEGVATFCILLSKEEQIETQAEAESEEATTPQYKTIYKSVVAMFPFAIDVDVNPNNEYLCSAQICNAVSRIHMRGELEISYTISVNLQQFSTENIFFLSNLEVLEPFEDDSLFSIYFADENQSAFSIAKQLKTSPEQIDIEGREVVFFRQK